MCWARLAAFVMRLTQSPFQQDTVRMHCFVDDPIASIRGTKFWGRLAVATIVLTWGALGFGLAYRKGQLRHKLVLIGGSLEINASGIDAAAKDAIVGDIAEALEKFKTVNVVSRKELVSFVSRANHAAGLLVTLRPFLQPLWAALSSANIGPTNTVWIKQVEHPMSWMRALFNAEIPGHIRRFGLEQYRNVGPSAEIGTDASPYGPGGWYAVAGSITHHYYCEISQPNRARVMCGAAGA